MRYWEYIREEGRRMDQNEEISVGDLVILKGEDPDSRVGRVVQVYADETGEFWAEVHHSGYMDHYENYPLSSLEVYQYNDYSGPEDNVNHPQHYGTGSIECIDYIKDFLTLEEYQGYLRGNIAKYLHRWPYKNGVEDLKKAEWYLKRLIESEKPENLNG